jgi:hypothetical protein
LTASLNNTLENKLKLRLLLVLCVSNKPEYTDTVRIFFQHAATFWDYFDKKCQKACKIKIQN